MPTAIDNLLCLAGAGLLLGGLAWIYAPLAPIAAGGLAIAAGIWRHRQRGKRTK